MTIDVQPLTGAALDAALGDLASLRIAVFREYPYLYDGDDAYERRYLASYRNSSGSILVGAFDGPKLVGASTGTPLSGHDPEFSAPVAEAGLPVASVFYCAESVVRPDHRGQGIGHRFFDIRETHAKSLGMTHSAFCSVVRDEDHPAKPAGYRPLDAFWRRRGYAPIAGAVAIFDWKEIGATKETPHRLQFWSRRL